MIHVLYFQFQLSQVKNKKLYGALYIYMLQAPSFFWGGGQYSCSIGIHFFWGGDVIELCYRPKHYFEGVL